MGEQDLIQAAQRGDRRAFDRLVLEYQAIVYNVAYRIMGEREAASDATQEAFLSAYRNMKRFRGGSFKGWLLRIVTNACYDQLRRLERRPTSSLEAISLESGSLFEKGEEPDEYAIRQELSRVIQLGITSLSPEQRTAVVLSDIQGLSYEEIAQVMGTNLGTVKSRLSRARSALRDYLLAQGELLPSPYRLKVGNDSREKDV